MADMWNSVSDRDYREEIMGPDPREASPVEDVPVCEHGMPESSGCMACLELAAAGFPEAGKLLTARQRTEEAAFREDQSDCPF